MLYATVGTEDEAVKLAEHLLTKRLVACANIIPTRSLYRWKGKIRDEREFALVMKTRTELVEGAIKEAKGLHSYHVPCLVSYSMETGLPEYLRWIDVETRRPRPKWGFKCELRSCRSPRLPSWGRHRRNSHT